MRRVQGPAIALIIVAAIGICFQILGMIARVLGLGLAGMGGMGGGRQDFPMIAALAGTLGVILSILGCLWIIKDLRAVTIEVFVIWVAVAFLWYFIYGFKHSHLGRHEHVGLAQD